jgi:hypothetical protein
MSRKRTQSFESLGESAITWFFIGMMMIAATAGLLGHMVAG